MLCAFLVIQLSLHLTYGFEPTEDGFRSWMQQYKASHKYTEASQFAQGFHVWKSNWAVVESINAGQSLWKAELNHFADMTPEDFAKKVLMSPHQGDVGIATHKAAEKTISRGPHTASDSKSFDWRNVGGVSPVQDQGTVGTCWAFSTVGNVEGQHFLKTNQTINLSEEFLVDCDGTHDDTHADCGIFGGWPYLAYDFILKAKGLPSDESYPYCVGSGDCFPCMQGPVSICGPPPYYCDKDTEKLCPPHQVS